MTGRDKSYQKLLYKMLWIEDIGDIIYKSLASKIKDRKFRLVYERLALNEQKTARYIENEILRVNRNYIISVNGIILNPAKLICSILTVRQLSWILRTILKRRMYSKWYYIYKDKNRELWQLLLNHENLQHELLSQPWNN